MNVIRELGLLLQIRRNDSKGASMPFKRGQTSIPLRLIQRSGFRGGGRGADSLKHFKRSNYLRISIFRSGWQEGSLLWEEMLSPSWRDLRLFLDFRWRRFSRLSHVIQKNCQICLTMMWKWEPTVCRRLGWQRTAWPLPGGCPPWRRLGSPTSTSASTHWWRQSCEIFELFQYLMMIHHLNFGDRDTLANQLNNLKIKSPNQPNHLEVGDKSPWFVEVSLSLRSFSVRFRKSLSLYQEDQWRLTARWWRLR